MAVINSFVDVVSPVTSSGLVAGKASVTTVVVGGSSPTTTTNTSTSVVQLALPGGTVVNVQWGYGLPPVPYEGQIWIQVTP